jgi:hypothetical protein
MQLLCLLKSAQVGRRAAVCDAFARRLGAVRTIDSPLLVAGAAHAKMTALRLMMLLMAARVRK